LGQDLGRKANFGLNQGAKEEGVVFSFFFACLKDKAIGHKGFGFTAVWP